VGKTLEQPTVWVWKLVAVGRLRFGFGWAAVRVLGGGALAVVKVSDERLFTKSII